MTTNLNTVWFHPTRVSAACAYQTMGEFKTALTSVCGMWRTLVSRRDSFTAPPPGNSCVKCAAKLGVFIKPSRVFEVSKKLGYFTREDLMPIEDMPNCRPNGDDVFDVAVVQDEDLEKFDEEET